MSSNDVTLKRSSKRFRTSEIDPSSSDGSTPLHLAISSGNKDLIKTLLNSGGDILATDATGKTPLHEIFYGHRVEILLIERLKDDKILQKRVQERTGLTMLHFACRVLDTDLVKHLLLSGADVNVKSLDTGETPLHTSIEVCISRLFDRGASTAITVVQMLLDYGADVMSINNRGDTPILMLTLFSLHRFLSEDAQEYGAMVDRLLMGQKDFSINPVNSKGISHFHIACIRNQLGLIQEFLKHSIEVNRPIDCRYNMTSHGLTALHLALTSHDDNSSKLPDVMDLLIANGADVNAEDKSGNTPLHVAVKSQRLRHVVLEKLMQAGADINKINNKGNTPFEELLNSDEIAAEDFSCFTRRGCRIDDYRPRRQNYSFYNNKTRSYITMIIESCLHYGTQESFDAMLEIYDVTQKDAMGRTALHNTVAIEYFDRFNNVYNKYNPWFYDLSYNVQRLLELGCDIDHQDDEGKTALHIATQLRNPCAVFCLLENGADINQYDKSGEPAFIVCLKYLDSITDIDVDDRRCMFQVGLELLAQVSILQTFKLDVSQSNLDARDTFRQRYGCSPYVMAALDDEVKITKSQNIGSTSIKMQHLLSETGIVANYPYLSITVRQEIDKFLKTFDEKRFPYGKRPLRLQYRKALKRSSLLEPATNSLRLLIGFPLPDLCCEAIFKFLSNNDLNNVVTSSLK